MKNTETANNRRLNSLSDKELLLTIRTTPGYLTTNVQLARMALTIIRERQAIVQQPSFGWLRRHYVDVIRLFVTVAFALLALVGTWGEYKEWTWVLVRSSVGEFLVTLLVNAGPELGGIVISLVIIDWINDRRNERELRSRLIQNMKSRHNVVSNPAVSELRNKGWGFGSDKSLAGIRIRNANLEYTILRNANFDGSFLGEVLLKEADLAGSSFERATLSEVDLSSACLIDANMKGAILMNTNLSHANLSGACLSHAFAVEANFRGAFLWKAELDDAELSETDLSWCALIDANLSRANLKNANLRKTSLAGADLTEADLDGAVLTNASLEGATVSVEQLKNIQIEATLTMPDGTYVHARRSPTLADWLSERVNDRQPDEVKLTNDVDIRVGIESFGEEE